MIGPGFFFFGVCEIKVNPPLVEEHLTTRGGGVHHRNRTDRQDAHQYDQKR